MAQPRPHDEEKAQKIKEMLGARNLAPVPVVDESEEEAQINESSVLEDAQPESAENTTKAGRGFGVKLDKEKLLRTLWTVASIISMTVTVVVLILGVVLYRVVNKFPVAKILALVEEKKAPLPPDYGIDDLAAATEKTIDNMPPEIGLNTPLDLLQGLYDNFELMDNAHIKTDILVEDEIPVQFTLGLNQETVVILSEPVTIPGARVALTTGGLNIFNAPATVTLPAGTSLPIVLDLEVPVNEMVPIALNVPVDIALADTDLHKPFVGLQEVVRPLYCLVKPDAINGNDALICEIPKEPVE